MACYVTQKHGAFLLLFHFSATKLHYIYSELSQMINSILEIL